MAKTGVAKLDRMLKIGQFEIDRHAITDNQILLLAIAIDPTPKQREVLDAFGVKFFDSNGKNVYPGVKDVTSR